MCYERVCYDVIGWFMRVCVMKGMRQAGTLMGREWPVGRFTTMPMARLPSTVPRCDDDDDDDDEEEEEEDASIGRAGRVGIVADKALEIAFNDVDEDDDDDEDDAVGAKGCVDEEDPPAAATIQEGAAASRSVQPRASRARSADRCRSRVNRSWGKGKGKG